MTVAKQRLKSVFALFPKRCVFCGELVSPYLEYCERCSRQISTVELPVCEKCGRGKQFCSCRLHSRFFDRISAPYYYEKAVRRGIHRLKFRGGKRNCAFFAERMCEAYARDYSELRFDCSACVPSTAVSIKERGYNQSKLLAQAVSERLGIDFCDGLLVKLYETASQHSIGILRRKGNLTGVFDVSPQFSVDGKSILLIDDVATSGETLDECAKMLYLHGAQSISCLTIALTIEKKNTK